MPLSLRGSRHRRDPRFRSRPGHRCFFRPGFVFLHRGELQRCPSGHFLCKERALAIRLQKSTNFFYIRGELYRGPSGHFFVQGASVGNPVTEVDQFFLYKERALATLLPSVRPVRPFWTPKNPKNPNCLTIVTISATSANRVRCSSVNRC